MPTFEELMAAGAQPVAAPAQAAAPTPLAPTGLTLEQLQAAGATPYAAPEPSAAEALGRGALQGVSLGFSDEITGAIGSLFSDKSYSQIRDESRAANDAAKNAHGGYYLGGELGGGIASALIPGLGAARGASLAAAAGKGALAAGLGGLGTSTADLTKGDFAHAAIDTAKAAAAGAVIGGVAKGVGNMIEHAPEKARENLINLVTRGEGMSGSATPTAQKLLVRNKDNVINALEQKFLPEGEAKAIKLADLVGRPAKDALPVVEERLQQIGGTLDQHYDVVDKATGGVSLGNLVEFLDNEVSRLKKTPLNEQYVKAVEDIKQSALTAWAPEMQSELDAAKRLTAMGLQNRKVIEDVHVPTRDVRALVTRLQTRGSQVINPLNPGESSIMKQDMGKLMKDFIDSHLDIAGETSPDVVKAVTAIRDINKTYSGLKSVEKALIQRGEKEAAGATSLKAHGINLLGHGGLIGAGALAAHGNIPAAVATLALPKVLAKAPAMGRAVTGAASKANSLIETLTQAAEAGNPWAKAQLSAMQATPTAAAVVAGEHL